MSTPMKEGSFLTNGQNVNVGGTPAVVVGQLGCGGQGEVYKVRCSNGKEFALKWYAPGAATPVQRQILERLIPRPAPDARFVWPLAIATAPQMTGFGYMMKLIPPQFKELLQVRMNKVPIRRRMVAMCLAQIANSLLKLHTRGMFYGDLNYKNFFVDPGTGDALIVDNDNVQVEGAPDATIAGTGTFRAPEIVRGEATPSKYTDQFSLAVLAYQILVMGHPYEGKMDEEMFSFEEGKERLIYGDPAPFVFHPTDRSNAADAGTTTRWYMLPAFIRDVFHQAFTETVNKPMARVAETTWQKAFLRLHDSVVACGNCRRESYYDRAAVVASAKAAPRPPADDGAIGACWGCKAPLRMPARLRLQRDNDARIITLSSESVLYETHIGEQESWEFSKPLAVVEEHPRQKGVYGLKNNTDRSWLCTRQDGTRFDAPPQTRVKLSHGTKIQFGRVKGEFRC